MRRVRGRVNHSIEHFRRIVVELKLFGPPGCSLAMPNVGDPPVLQGHR